MIVFCENGWQEVWNQLVASGKLARIRLYQNNYLPVLTDTAADYTEANFSGYIGFTALAWGAAFINPAVQGEIDATQVVWVHNGGATPNTIYGIYVTDPADALIYAERFDAPIKMEALGNTIKYVPIATVVNQ